MSERIKRNILMIYYLSRFGVLFEIVIWGSSRYKFVAIIDPLKNDFLKSRDK